VATGFWWSDWNFTKGHGLAVLKVGMLSFQFNRSKRHHKVLTQYSTTVFKAVHGGRIVELPED
jgi:hypothetical protein